MRHSDGRSEPAGPLLRPPQACGRAGHRLQRRAAAKAEANDYLHLEHGWRDAQLLQQSGFRAGRVEVYRERVVGTAGAFLNKQSGCFHSLLECKASFFLPSKNPELD